VPPLGAHMSIAGGLHKAFERIRAIGGEALQIFTRNQRQWHCPTLTQREMDLFRSEWEKTGPVPVAAHSSYLINLSRPEDEMGTKSIRAFTEELQRAESLSIQWLITHPGAHLGAGAERGLENFIRNLDAALKLSGTKRVEVLVETTAGQGTCLGGTFEELAFILFHSSFKDRLGVCLDTCHIFAAGHDLRDERTYEETLSLVQKTFGMEKIKFIHLNDSKAPLGSHLDRHEHIGKGQMGLNPFRFILNDSRLSRIPMVLETPKGPKLEEDKVNLATLRSLFQGYN